MKVLVVDDEPLVRRSLVRAFAMGGHEVLEADNGEDALTLWRQASPDVVFLDVWMPKKTGPQVLEEMSGHHKAFVILMSAFAGEIGELEAKQKGAHVFLPKPFSDIFQVVATTERQYQARQSAGNSNQS